MSYDDKQIEGDEERLIPWNVLLTVWKNYRRLIVGWSLGLSALVAVFGAVHLWWLQPVQSVSTLNFRPTFIGASIGEYANGLMFSASDIASQPILDIVYEENSLEAYCSRAAFRSAIFVEESSSEGLFLELEYSDLLSNQGLSIIDRGTLELEYEAKRDALSLQYRLTYVHPLECATIPQVVIAKSLTDILSTWAAESVKTRGVLSIRTSILTPSIMDVGKELGSLPFLRADLLRTSLLRVLDNVEEVMHLPGSDVIGAGPDRTGFAEIHAKLMAIVESVLEPLVITAARSMNEESVFLLTERIARHERLQTAAAGQAFAFRDALREYSGVALSAEADRASAQVANTSSSDMQTLQPQIDRTFIDRIVEMSEASTIFRQELTEGMVERTMVAIESEKRSNYYQQLLDSIPGSRQRQGRRIELDLDGQLDLVVDQGKELITEFNNLYTEFSQISLRASSALYQIESAVFNLVSRSFTTREYLTIIPLTFLTLFCLLFVSYLVRYSMFS